MSGTRKTGARAPELPFDAFRTMAGGAEALQPLLKSASRINLEIAGFATGRARAWVGAQAALMRCRTPQDVLEAQLGFWREANREWLAAGQRIGEALQSALAFDGAGNGKTAERDYIDLASDAHSPEAPLARNGHAPRRSAERRAAA